MESYSYSILNNPQKTPSTLLNGGLHAIDIVIIIGILAGILVIGGLASFKAHDLKCCGKREKMKDSNISIASPNHRQFEDQQLPYQQQVERNAAAEFFLADRSMAWYFVGASLFSSNIGSEHFIGQAGDGARRGLGVAMYEWYASILLLCLGWIFSPIYRRAGIYTTPQFLEYRFGPYCRHYLSFITCIMYVLTKMSASVYGGAIVLSSTLGWDLYWSAGLCIFLSALYTTSGGLRAVMYTDLFQMFIFLIGGFFVMGVCLYEVGGFSGLQQRLKQQNKQDYWHLFKPIDDEDYPWTGMLFGQPMGSLWYWCMDQDLVQRVLSAKDDVHSRGGCIMAAFLKIIPPFIMVIPGIVASVLYDFNTTTNADHAYPMLLTNLMPHGVIGLMIASIMAAMMSSLDSLFNAGASIIANDVYKLFYPKANHKTLTIVGRFAVILFAILSFLWIPILSSGNGLYRQVVEIQGYLTPPIGIILLIGVTWKRATYAGALAGLLVGGGFGIGRLILTMYLRSSLFLQKNKDSILYPLIYMNFQHYAIFLWILSALVCIVVSLFTTSTHKEDSIQPYLIQYHQLFQRTTTEKEYGLYSTMLLNIGAICILILVICLWIYFG